MQPLNDADALALTMLGEARGEGALGMVAVGNVIMNRWRENPTRFGQTIKDVCLKPDQFDCWNINDPNRAYLLALPPTDASFKAALSIAQGLMAETIADNTHGATSYYAESMAEPPYWAVGKIACAQVGHQLFFKNV